jgi:hypothetical protein
LGAARASSHWGLLSSLIHHICLGERKKQRTHTAYSLASLAESCYLLIIDDGLLFSLNVGKKIKVKRSPEINIMIEETQPTEYP